MGTIAVEVTAGRVPVVIGVSGVSAEVALGFGGHAKAIGAGVLLATPLVLLFGTIFASADPVFGTAVSSVMTGSLGPLISHSITAGALAWASAGYLWVLAKPPRPYAALVKIPEIGGIQVLTPLVA